MLSLHQLRCFLAAYEHGSFTAAAAELGYAQPTLAEQVRLLERTLKSPLFLRRGRGIVPTPAAATLRPHAERMLAAALQAEQAMQSIASLDSGTVRFGIAGNASLNIQSAVIAEVLKQHPGLRVECVGRHTEQALDAVRRGELEAAIVVLPVPASDLIVEPVGRFEYVYISRDPTHLTGPVDAHRLASASLVLPLAQYRAVDTYRLALAGLAQSIGASLNIRIEVEDLETAVDLVDRGLADSVVPVPFTGYVSRTAPDIRWVALKPRLYDTLALVRWKDASLSPGSRLMIDLFVAAFKDLLRNSATSSRRASSAPAGAAPPPAE